MPPLEADEVGKRTRKERHVPEKKRDVSSFEPMAMTKSVHTSLLVLRAYLILMACLVVYRFVSLF